MTQADRDLNYYSFIDVFKTDANKCMSESCSQKRNRLAVNAISEIPSRRTQSYY